MAKIRVSKGELFMANQTVDVIAYNVIDRLGGMDIEVLQLSDELADIEFYGLAGSKDLHPQLQARGINAEYLGEN